ncbi:hypothetical protein DF153_20105 [Burkholderia cenocepacia]|nr:hypothetical protein DF152_22335 [Burkholderia cenocepacia]RQU22513.1 hypothetical protein DF153_20105 [Burkholderia cenocepacia]
MCVAIGDDNRAWCEMRVPFPRSAGRAAASGRPAPVQLNAAHTRYAFSPTITTVAAPATIRSGIRIA